MFRTFWALAICLTIGCNDPVDDTVTDTFAHDAPVDATSSDVRDGNAPGLDATSRDIEVLRDTANGEDAPSGVDTGTSGDTGPLVGFALLGDPSSAEGATWTYVADEEGVSYILAGALLVPSGDAPEAGFAAVLLSHATGGSATSVAVNHGQRMREWGMIAISVNYTHANAEIVPGESPGEFRQMLGASEANISRARKCVDILESLGNVDMTRIAAHGHSRGALVTGGFAGQYPDLLRVASHTAGGVDDTRIDDGFISSSQASAITVPYQLHHGTEDPVVPPATGQRLAGILEGNGVVHELWLYEGRRHNIASLPNVLSRIRSWYEAHGVL